MPHVKKLVLDVLKPHQPNALEFCEAIASSGAHYLVHLTVLEVDKSTETVQITVQGESIDFEALHAAINNLGGSLHSIDEVEVRSED